MARKSKKKVDGSKELDITVKAPVQAFLEETGFEEVLDAFRIFL